MIVIERGSSCSSVCNSVSERNGAMPTAAMKTNRSEPDPPWSACQSCARGYPGYRAIGIYVYIPGIFIRTIMEIIIRILQ